MIVLLSGGNSYQELIRRTLGRFFSDELATKCSWTGRKNNFALNELKIMNIFKNTFLFIQKIFYGTNFYGIISLFKYLLLIFFRVYLFTNTNYRLIFT